MVISTSLDGSFLYYGPIGCGTAKVTQHNLWPMTLCRLIGPAWNPCPPTDSVGPVPASSDSIIRTLYMLPQRSLNG